MSSESLLTFDFHEPCSTRTPHTGQEGQSKIKENNTSLYKHKEGMDSAWDIWWTQMLGLTDK